MKPPMYNTAVKYAHTRNAYGDYTLSTTTTLPCHFRYITEQVTTTSSEAVQSDAMAWFEPDSGVVKGDILLIENEHFRAERIIHARKLRDNNVQFIKVYLSKYGLIS